MNASLKTDLKPGRGERSGQIQSVMRAVSVLDALSACDDGMTLTTIAYTVGLPPSTAHRLLTTLQQARYVSFDKERGGWRVGVGCFSVGNSFLRSRDIVGICRPYMRRLMEESGETVNLAIRDGEEMVYLAQVECREMMRALARPGARVPIVGSAVGKTFLARLPPEMVGQSLERSAPGVRTRKTIDALPRMMEELGVVRQRRYAIDDEEHAIGLRCVAAAVFDHFAEPLGAISISGPTARITDARLPQLGELTRIVAQETTAALGGVWQDQAMMRHDQP